MEIHLQQESKYQIIGYKTEDIDHCIERLMELGFVLSQAIIYRGQILGNGAHLLEIENSLVALRDEEFQCLQLKEV